MTIEQPTLTNKLNAPDHSLMHRQIATDPSAPAKSLVVSSTGNTGAGTETPNSRLHSIGSFATGYVEKTAAYTLDETDSIVCCNTNSFNITLPTAVGITGRVYSIKNTGTGTITVDGDGTETIDGDLTTTVEQYENIKIMSNGANWIVI